jgi:hypothetical protein
MPFSAFNSTEKLVERTTDGLAVGAVSSWLWLPSLNQLSDISAQLLPIVGLVWLVIQMVYYLQARFRRQEREVSNREIAVTKREDRQDKDEV